MGKIISIKEYRKRKPNYDEFYKQDPDWILDGDSESPPGYVGTWTHQEPYGPPPKKEQTIKPKFQKLFDLAKKRRTTKLLNAYLKSLQEEQMKSKTGDPDWPPAGKLPLDFSSTLVGGLLPTNPH